MSVLLIKIICVYLSYICITYRNYTSVITCRLEKPFRASVSSPTIISGKKKNDKQLEFQQREMLFTPLARVSLEITVGEIIVGSPHTPSPPTKSLGFEGLDSSRLLILRGGNSHVRCI